VQARVQAVAVTGWRPVKPPAMPEATRNRKPGLRLAHVTG
jgi:hypothetical protein